MLQPQGSQHASVVPELLLVCSVTNTGEWLSWKGPLSRRVFLVAVSSPFILNFPFSMCLTEGTLATRNGPLQACLGSLSCAAWYTLKATPSRMIASQLCARWQHSTQLHAANSHETPISEILCYCHFLELKVSLGCHRCQCVFLSSLVLITTVWR